MSRVDNIGRAHGSLSFRAPTVLASPSQTPPQVLSLDQVCGKQASKLCVMGKPGPTLLPANGAPTNRCLFLGQPETSRSRDGNQDKGDTGPMSRCCDLGWPLLWSGMGGPPVAVVQ